MNYTRICYLLLLTGMGMLWANACKNEYVQNEPVCFERDVYPIIVSSCTQSGCHNAVDREKGRDYTTYEGILRDVKKGNYRSSQLYQIIQPNFGSMPPSPYNKLSDEQLLIIATWIQEGAVNDTCSAGVACDTSGTISYTAQVKPILQSWCNSCHGGTAQAGGGISLSAYTSVKASVNNGSLVGSIEHASGFSAMPKNGNKLSNCNIATIKKWAESGAPNN
jgi:mono/diheme cytochrome c family protein